MSILEIAHRNARKLGLKGWELVGQVYVELELMKVISPDKEDEIKAAIAQWNCEINYWGKQ